MRLIYKANWESTPHLGAKFAGNTPGAALPSADSQVFKQLFHKIKFEKNISLIDFCVKMKLPDKPRD